MGRSSVLRMADVRAAFRLVGDCRDLGHDIGQWYPVALAGLRELTGSRTVVGGIASWWPLPDVLQDPLTNLWGTGFTDSERRKWESLLSSPRALDFKFPLMTAAVRSRQALRIRPQLLTDREWYRSAEYQHRSELGVDDCVISQYWLGPRRLQGFNFDRGIGEGRMPLRQRRIVKLFHDELIRLYGSHIRTDRRPDPFADLPTRQREVLAALAEGDAEKQVAAKLGLSRHTVHDHVIALYRRFGVRSRAELVAIYWRLLREND